MRRESLLLAVGSLLAIPAILSAETHRLDPKQFHNTFSAAHAPVLRVKPGDRVVTKTVDAGGTDWDGKSVAMGPNPQTGPFYIEGAAPGDMLIVRIEKLEYEIANVVDPAFTVAAKIRKSQLPPRK